jgi:hypothetical protein
MEAPQPRRVACFKDHRSCLGPLCSDFTCSGSQNCQGVHASPSEEYDLLYIIFRCRLIANYTMLNNPLGGDLFCLVTQRQLPY